MKALGSVIRAPLKAIGFIPKMPKVPGPQKPVTRDDARDAADRQDELRSRTGSLGDIVTGVRGAEAGATGKIRLG